MRIGLLFAVVTTLGWLAGSAPASACKCAVRKPAEYYREAEHALHVKVVEVVQRTEVSVTYRAELLEDDFKGCLKAHARVVLTTAAESATCGVKLAPGEEALVYGRPVDRSADAADASDGEASYDLAPVPGQPLLTMNTCNGTQTWSQVTAQHRDFLATRPKSCGGKRQQTCEGKGVVQCFVDPCTVSQCDVAGAVCQSSYCGGCNARWFAPDGQQVCAPKPACRHDDPSRRYVAKSPDGCKVVRFACHDGEEMFFDACGCGCARP